MFALLSIAPGLCMEGTQWQADRLDNWAIIFSPIIPIPI